MSSPPPAPTPERSPVKRRGLRGCLLPFAVLFLLLSLLLNLVFVLGYTGAINDPLAEEPDAVNEQFYLGDASARDKIAVVRVSGVITDASIAYPVQQLRSA